MGRTPISLQNCSWVSPRSSNVPAPLEPGNCSKGALSSKLDGILVVAEIAGRGQPEQATDVLFAAKWGQQLPACRCSSTSKASNEKSRRQEAKYCGQDGLYVSSRVDAAMCHVPMAR